MFALEFAAVAVLLALAVRANHARAHYRLWLAASVKSQGGAVAAVAIHRKAYYLMGLARSPGAHDLTAPTTVMEALVAAGGLLPDADLEHIVIMRGGGRLQFNFVDVRNRKNLRQNVPLEPGDIVLVK